MDKKSQNREEKVVIPAEDIQAVYRILTQAVLSEVSQDDINRLRDFFKLASKIIEKKDKETASSLIYSQVLDIQGYALSHLNDAESNLREGVVICSCFAIILN